MNIAITANTAWNLYNFRKALILLLLKEGHRVFAIAPQDESVDKLVAETGVTFLSLVQLSRKGSNPIQDVKLIREYQKIYQDNKIDVAIQYTIKPNIYGSIAGARTGTKTISNLTGLGYVFLNKSLKNRIAKKLYKMALAKTNVACFHNEADAKLFKELKLVKADKINVVHGSGVDADYFQYSPRRENDQFVFLFIGRLLYDKGIRELLEAYKKLSQAVSKPVVLHILGDIDEGNPASLSTTVFEQYTNTLNIQHHGMQDDVKPYINASDCVVLPSYREGLPKSLIEAMSMERPIITVNSVGCAHLIVNNQNGYLAEVKSSESLFQQMKKMVDLSAEQRKTMGAFGRKLVLENYSAEIINKQYIKLISQLDA